MPITRQRPATKRHPEPAQLEFERPEGLIRDEVRQYVTTVVSERTAGEAPENGAPAAVSVSRADPGYDADAGPAR